MKQLLMELLSYQEKKANRLYQEWLEADRDVIHTEEMIAKLESESPANVN